MLSSKLHWLCMWRVTSHLQAPPPLPQEPEELHRDRAPLLNLVMAEAVRGSQAVCRHHGLCLRSQRSCIVTGRPC